MPKSKSKSVVTTTTEQFDQRAVAESGAIAIGGGSDIDYTQIDEFSDNVAQAFENLLDFATEAGAVAADFASEAGETAAKQVAATTETLSAELERKATLIPTAITQILPYVTVGFFAIAAIILFKKR